MSAAHLGTVAFWVQIGQTSSASAQHWIRESQEVVRERFWIETSRPDLLAKMKADPDNAKAMGVPQEQDEVPTEEKVAQKRLETATEKEDSQILEGTEIGQQVDKEGNEDRNSTDSHMFQISDTMSSMPCGAQFMGQLSERYIKREAWKRNRFNQYLAHRDGRPKTVGLVPKMLKLKEINPKDDVEAQWVYWHPGDDTEAQEK